MTTMPIIILPDPILRQVSEPIATVDDGVRKLADDMLETMYAAPGVGLAAIQVGVARRLLVIDVADAEKEGRKPLVMINPEIVARGGATRVYEEGCLSIPDVRLDIERPAEVTVRYLDRQGQPVELVARGLLATAIQHELDHLDGRMIIDFMSRLRRDMVIRRFKKMARTGETA
jgi:peptide deformylase